MNKFFTIWCIFISLLFGYCSWFGVYPSSKETMEGAPSVKTMRNNPSAYRSFSSHGFTGK